MFDHQLLLSFLYFFFFFNDTATTEIYTLSLHDALPICCGPRRGYPAVRRSRIPRHPAWRSEEHTSELQSRPHLVCRLLLEKKKRKELDQLIFLAHHDWRRLCGIDDSTSSTVAAAAPSSV